VVVVGADGLVKHSGVQFPTEVWTGDGADLGGVDLLVLVACAVGRPQQDRGRDVEGLYARLVANRGRSVVAAKWPIADTEAALLVGDLVSEYLKEFRRTGEVRPFDRSRALNRARQRMLDAELVTVHQAAAFDVYGLG
jgi:CHAT domain-containing protein